MQNNKFHDELKRKMDDYAFGTYAVTKKFPKDEMYGITSQLRRSALSVILNYIEGFARTGDKQLKNFLNISYGSLKESKYLLYFSRREEYVELAEYEKLINLSEEIGAMLWTTIQGLKEKD
ncbi:MAG: four helix bundle protein [Candidatus Moranbacteria bacterium]|nr:four helix bundle protein [Candidatus Moranbacteria bacterium]